MRSKCVNNGFRASKMTSEVGRRRRRAALESSEATKEALGGSRTAFRRLNGAVQGDRGGPRRLQDGILEVQGRRSMRDTREMREGRRDVRGLSELNLDEVLPGSHTPCTPDKQGAADLSAPRIPPDLHAFTEAQSVLCLRGLRGLKGLRGLGG